MMTQHGKAIALTALATRRERYKDVKLVDNSLLPANSPMYFSCIGCGMTITEPEGFITRRMCCDECEALRYFGWME